MRLPKFKSQLKTAALVALYLGAAAAANLAVARYGSAAMPVTAFLLIPFDLSSRDLLHERWEGRGLFLRMAALVAAGSTLSYLISPSSGRVALASAASFAVAGGADALAYHVLRGWPRSSRMNLSNVCGAVFDSVAFPLLAFGATTFWLSAGQAGTKVAGGYLWTLLFVRLVSRPLPLADSPEFCFDCGSPMRRIALDDYRCKGCGETWRVTEV